MFGYVKTDYLNLIIKDSVLYRSMYCGLCKGIKCNCGNCARLALNYDLTFLSIFAHNIMGQDVKIEKQRCIVSWFKKKPIAVPDNITKRVASLNIILAYHKCNDDVIDNGRGRIKRSFFSRSYKKAIKLEPKFDEIVKKHYSKLLEYEKQNIDSIDMSADPFGNMMKELVLELVGDYADENVLELSYLLGKWIYLIDALDDFDKDKKRHSFNVFVNIYGNAFTKSQLLQEKASEIQWIFNPILSGIIEYTDNIKYKFNHDLVDNILRSGLRLETNKIMENKTCKSTTKF